VKNQLGKLLSIFIPMLIGIGIVYYQYTTLTEEDLSKIKRSFQKANYLYIYLSLGIAILGYWSRAYRWKYALTHLGYRSSFVNNFLFVCVSYFVNLTIPRSGEVTRAALLKKYENVPFDKGFGTIVAERIVDLFLFLLFVIIGFISQFDTLYGFLIKKNVSFETIIIYCLTVASIGILFLLIWIYAEWKILKKLKKKLNGLIEGMTSVFKMRDKWKYLLHTFFIWFSYLMMFYITIYALPETSNISFDIVILGFIFGSLAVGFTNGGLGAYPFSIALIFSLYGINNDVGVAFGWLIWTSQTVLAIFLGVISYLLLPVLNKNK
jgi:glycosyltransferase 2 family protein